MLLLLSRFLIYFEEVPALTTIKAIRKGYKNRG